MMYTGEEIDEIKKNLKSSRVHPSDVASVKAAYRLIEHLHLQITGGIRRSAQMPRSRG